MQQRDRQVGLKPALGRKSVTAMAGTSGHGVQSTRAGRRRRVAAGLSLALVVTLAGQAVAGPDPVEAAQPRKAPQTTGIAVKPLQHTPRPSWTAARQVAKPPAKVTWPEAGVATVDLAAVAPDSRNALAGNGPAEAQVKAGSLPVSVAARAQTPVGKVTVEVLDRSAARQAGVDGVLLTVRRSDNANQAGSVKVQVDYSSFAGAFGGDWASRLRLVNAADRTVLSTDNDVVASTLTAIVPLSADGSVTTLSVQAGPSGDNGDYSATSLAPASTWQVSQQTGAFTWNYPVRMVPAVGGPQPSIALSYSSGTVDGRTGGTNSQGSWIGDGWDMWSGFVERKYRPCSFDTDEVGGNTPNNVDVGGGDQCWATVNGNATISLNGRSTELVKSSDNTWKGVSDDGSRIELLKDASLSNGDGDGEYWKVTTIDGTQYFFGRNYGIGGASATTATKSTWTTQVYGNHPGETGYVAGDFAASRTTQAWRWNLDYVVDTHGNTMTYFYEREAGAYGRENDPDKRTTYDRGGWLSRIEYGNRSDATSTTQAAARVVFDVADRCDANCWSGSDPVALSWLDTPWDQYCKAAPCTGTVSQTFWTAKRLQAIRTQVYAGSGATYNDVEQINLRHIYLSAGGNEGQPMWLAGITRVGKATTATGAEAADLAKDTDPEIIFDPGTEALANRVDGPSDNRSNLYRYRIATVTTETGAQIAPTYSAPECVRASLPSPSTNTQRCFPQYYAPPGEASTLDWFHKYAVTRIDVYDNTGGFTHEQTNYDYGTPAWHYDDSELVEEKKRTWGEFRGYDKVTVRVGLDSGSQTTTEYTYLRGMDGDKQLTGTRDVWITDSQGDRIEDHEAFAGVLREVATLSAKTGGVVLSGSISTPVVQGPTATSGPLKAWMSNTATVRNRERLSDGSYRWTKTVTTFNTDNLPTQVDDLGDEATANDDMCARTWYARNSANWMLGRVKRSETVSVNCDATASVPSDIVSSSRTTYDDEANDWDTFLPVKGDIVKVEEVDRWSGTSPVYVTTARVKYDANGRAVETYDALNQKSAVAYTPALTGPVTSTLTTDPLGRTVTTTLATAWGASTTITDNANNPTYARVDITYDALGRRKQVWLPGRAKASFPTSPTTDYAYSVRNNNPTAVTSRNLLWNSTPTYATSVVLYDGLLRERQTQTQAPGGGRSLTDTVRDSRGLVDWTAGPYYDTTNAPVDTTLYGGAGSPAPPSTVVSVYDGAGRLTDSIFKVGSTEKWRTTTTYNGELTSVTPPAGGTKIESKFDARGRTVEQRQYHSYTSSTYDLTTLAYTKVGQLASVTDAAGNVWKYFYDQRGRKIRDEDPDRGVTEITYDTLGQILTTKDARNVTLGYTYDPLGRTTSVRDGSTTGNKRIEWIYDTLANGVGKLTKAMRYEPAGSSNAYTNEITAYDTAGRPTGSKITIPSSEGGLCASGTLTPCEYVYAYTYKGNGQLNNTTLPAAGGLPSEKLGFTYNDVGADNGMFTASQMYVYSTGYYKTGQLSQRILGAVGKQVTQTYNVDLNTNRLTSTSVGTDITAEVFNFSYTYHDIGTVKRIADTPVGGSADYQCFTYDYQKRLTEAWTPTTGDCDTTPTWAAVGGPAKYWHSYEYTGAAGLTGSRTKETWHGTTNTVRTYNYPAQAGAAGSKPHTVTSVATTGAATKTENYQYDPTGNTTCRPATTTSTNTCGGTGSQSLTWDNEGHLATSTDATGTTSYIYDANGDRLIRKDPTGATLYLPGGTEVRKPTSTAAAGTRYYTHTGATIAVRTSAGTLQWLAADHHGTAEATINSTDLAVARRRTTPFGGPRGTTTGTWLTAMDKGFVGGTQDATGLTHLGAREYDPILGRFVSVDPLLDLSDPQSWHGYAYADNAPTTGSDATGLYNVPDSPGGGAWSPCSDGTCVERQGYYVRIDRHSSGTLMINNVAISSDVDPGELVRLLDDYCSTSGDPECAALTHQCGVGDQDCLDAVQAAIGDVLLMATEDAYGKSICDSCGTLFAAKLSVLLNGAGSDGGDGVGGEGGNTGGKKKTGNSGGEEGAGGVGPGKGFKARFGPDGEVLNAGMPHPTSVCKHSFAAGTLVLLADGTTKPIESVVEGDKVVATIPETGTSAAKQVTQLHVNLDTDLADVTVRDLDTGQKSVIHTTVGHPFWSASLHAWVNAGDLTAGTRLRGTDGRDNSIVESVDSWAGVRTMYNLTVADYHTYYVLAGNTPVLVHNDDDSIFYRGVKPGDPLSFEARLGVDFKVDANGNVIPGRGVSLTTDPSGLAKYGRTGVPVDMGSIPDGLEIVQVGKPGHYELAVKNGVSMTADEFQSKLGGVRGGGCL